LLVPAGVVTVTDAEPVPAGAVAVICVLLATVNAAGADPNLTPVAPVNPVPVMVTVFPPALGPWTGLMLLMTGAMT